MSRSNEPPNKLSDVEKLKHDWTYKNHVRLIEAKDSMASSHDKAILSMTAGALFLSITFISNVVQTNAPESTIILYISWLLYALTIVTMLAGYQISMNAFSIAADTLAKEYHGAPQKEVDKDNSTKKLLSNLVNLSNVCSLFFFCSATTLLLMFCAINFETRKESFMNETKLEEKGTTPSEGLEVNPKPVPVTK